MSSNYPTLELINALNHVKSVFPEVTMVIINNQGQWLYCDRNYQAPNFEDKIDVDILEIASSSIQETPYVYELPYEEDEEI